jgi:L-amino acid N-acyltransferase YncA
MIRIATPPDIEPIIERLLIPFHDEHQLVRETELDIDRIRTWVMEMVAEGRVIVVEMEGEIVGGIGFRDYEPPYANVVWLVDDFFYVRPEWRGGSVGLELERFFRDLAKSSKKTAILTVFNPGRVASRGRIARVFGLTPIGHWLRVA